VTFLLTPPIKCHVLFEWPLRPYTVPSFYEVAHFSMNYKKAVEIVVFLRWKTFCPNVLGF
jgi:hypothetical protein